jgi:hypothetical protein
MYNLPYNKHSMVNQNPIICSNWFFALQFGYLSFKSHEICAQMFVYFMPFPMFFKNLYLNVLRTFYREYFEEMKWLWNNYSKTINKTLMDLSPKLSLFVEWNTKTLLLHYYIKQKAPSVWTCWKHWFHSNVIWWVQNLNFSCRLTIFYLYECEVYLFLYMSCVPCKLCFVCFFPY